VRSNKEDDTMKGTITRELSGIIILFVVLGCCITESDSSQIEHERYTLDTSWDEYGPFLAGLVRSEEAAIDQLQNATIYHIDLTLSNDYLSLHGREELRYTNQEDSPLNEICFCLFPNIKGGKMTVSDVAVNDQEVTPAYESQKSVLRVLLSVPLQPGDSTVIMMNFDVEIAQEKGGSYGLFGYFDHVLALDECYPLIPVYDDEGWNLELPPPYGDVTYNDASFYLVRVTAPEQLVIAASGIETDRQSEEGTQIVTFAAGPARDFYLAASEYYTVVSTTVGETTINSYAFSEQKERAEIILELAKNGLKSYSERFGPYPYREFDVVSTPMLAVGMEYPGIIALAFNLYDPSGYVSGLPSQVMLESATAHEVAHQWFYNVVGNDQVDHPWLDEAVVQYCTGLYYLDTYGEPSAREYRASWEYLWDVVGKAEIPIGLPLKAYEAKEYSPIVYGRGPLFVKALAEEMGQETFDAFLREYYESNKWEIGTEKEFRELAEKHCQCDLSTLFEEWVL
jgi:hypothetical protein